MNPVRAVFVLLLTGCATSFNHVEFYELNSGKGWEAKVRPEDVNNYVDWNRAIDKLLTEYSTITSVAQGHDLQVKVRYKDGSYFGTIEPDIDTIFMVLNKCGEKCAHIGWITE